jgi:hypothetical protein
LRCASDSQAAAADQQSESGGDVMTVQETLGKVMAALPELRQREVLDFAEFLSWREEQAAWGEFGRAQFARAYGANEQDYTSADLKPESCRIQKS